MKQGKPWWKSKTLWANVAIGLSLTGAEATNLGITPVVATWIMLIANIILRSMTNEPINMG